VSILRGQYLLLACFQSHFCSHLYVCLSLPVQLNFQPQGWRKQVVPEHLHLSAKGYHIPEDCKLNRSVMELACIERFVIYSRITKIYYRKIVGHIFTKPVQIEGTTQKIFFPVSCFSS